ncbi:acyclic terpene utilization AtuA family protein [Euzebya sp.]|uniref:acyclic terpene utilization AtuA family protein n=1 Tax=Euzebya sp. TaxID=1971409 RepID=UPI0035138017
MRERHGEGAVRVAGGQGFYGDTPAAIADLLTEEPDYLCLEALAELTLAILAKDRARDETLGYTRDLPLYLMAALPAVLAGRTRVITNAGGINPLAALKLLQASAARFDLAGLTVAVVTGDDLRARPDLLPSGFPAVDDLRFANAYLGVAGIVEALERGADIVITGRVADAALFLAPLVHEHGWSLDDPDHVHRLAAGTVVGHLLECSGQSTGGNHAGEWWTVPDPWRFGFPLADVTADGTATIFSPEVAGGRVDVDTVRQQLLYEVGDPTAYLTPDVVVDMTTVHLTDLGDDRVRVHGTRGRPATGRYKVVGATADGYAADISVAFGWPDAPAKARAAADIARKRIAEAGIALAGWHVELFGVDALHGPAAWRPDQPDPDPAEVVLRMAWSTVDADACAQVARHIVPLGLSAPPPGFTPANRARPKPSGLLRIHTDLVDRGPVDADVHVVIEEL